MTETEVVGRMSEGTGTNYVKVTNADQIGSAAARGVSSEMSGMRNEIRELRGDIDSLERKLDKIDDINNSIKRLEKRVVEVEEKKAQAKKEAKKSVYEQLEAKAEEKRKKYKKKLREVLGEYKDRIDRLKDRFLNSIAHRSESFKQVKDEFVRVHRSKSDIRNKIEDVGDAAKSDHEKRLKSVIGAKKSFVGSVNEFLRDREETAELIDSIQTDINGLNGTEELRVPFWVVGIEKDGSEEILVYPIQGIGSVGQVSDEETYSEYLREHPEHSYGDMTDAVKEFVQRDSVRDSLADSEGGFADPSVLKSRGAANQRFVDSLVDYELSNRDSAGVASSKSSRGAVRGGDD